MNVVVNIDSDNDAFASPHGGREVARILRNIADRIEHGAQTEGICFDVNGASVGTWSLERNDP